MKNTNTVADSNEKVIREQINCSADNRTTATAATTATQIVDTHQIPIASLSSSSLSFDTPKHIKSIEISNNNNNNNKINNAYQEATHSRNSSASSSNISLNEQEIEAVVVATCSTPMSASIRMKNGNASVKNGSPLGPAGKKADYAVIDMSDNLCSHRNDELLHNNDGYCKTILALLLMGFSMMLNLFILAVVHERVPRDERPLPDLGFDIFPRFDFALNISEYIIEANCIIVGILLFIHRFRQIIFRRIAVIMSVLYLFRALCMISTVFPLANNKYYCQPQLFNSTNPMQISTGEYIGELFKRVFRMSLGFGLSINGQHNYCGDYLYSGHTLILTTCYLITREYLIPLRCRTLLWKLFHLIVFCSVIVGIISIIVARGHYLIDIILAYYVSTRVFWIYHTLAYNHDLIYSSTNYVNRVWWFHFFTYFELNKATVSINGVSTQRPVLHCDCNCDSMKMSSCTCSVIPRSFEWPLPWPRTFRFRTILPHQQSCDQKHRQQHQHQQPRQMEKELHGIRIE